MGRVREGSDWGREEVGEGGVSGEGRWRRRGEGVGGGVGSEWGREVEKERGGRRWGREEDEGVCLFTNRVRTQRY